MVGGGGGGGGGGGAGVTIDVRTQGVTNLWSGKNTRELNRPHFSMNRLQSVYNPQTSGGLTRA